MIFVSPILNSYYRFRLKSNSYRQEVYKKALKKELRHGRLGHIILRNLGEVMARDTSMHAEFSALVGAENYQKSFWESDLGYLWYQGNLHAQNKYFEFALEEIKKNKLQSVLDVGCGWGRFCVDVIRAGVKNCKGIDISADIILQAKNSFPAEAEAFEHKDVLEETGNYDLVTLFGSTDYIPPAIYGKVLEHIVLHTNKEIIIVNSLRGVPLEKAMEMETALEIKRYDDGYLQVTNYLLQGLQKKHAFTYNIRKFGSDSLMAVILKS
ncbi:MAG TPA: class I SAM-dependent methyltransferase [Bacteroidia bacterium]|jgi:cyclopropane fatty-acyl-phospholipid synthase-like methyltransferase|nr:class I SAM-dependent methyltransferase [Bacteroidia bacterium]